MIPNNNSWATQSLGSVPTLVQDQHLQLDALRNGLTSQDLNGTSTSVNPDIAAQVTQQQNVDMAGHTWNSSSSTPTALANNVDTQQADSASINSYENEKCEYVEYFMNNSLHKFNGFQ